ncbi:MAG: nuclear transport factor 2 family protein [Vicinamibacteria bacterium]|nr:nuclear transport factor 2 family protein [Vicinamibacteria bacterium]
MISRRVFATLALAFSSALMLILCHEPHDPIRALLVQLESAAERKDASAILSRLTPDFRCASGASRDDAASLLHRYFSAYETFRLDIYDVAVEREESRAVLRCRVDFCGKTRSFGGLNALLPPSAMYRFDLRLVLMGDRWSVREAHWEELSSSSAPAPASQMATQAKT